MISGPLLFDCLIMLILFVREASQLLVQVKTNELKRKKKASEKKNAKKDAKSKKEQ
jgi:Na+-transporting methylmalonyl-CoA/oxaloacetate decarboxylase gamma subunit